MSFYDFFDLFFNKKDRKLEHVFSPNMDYCIVILYGTGDPIGGRLKCGCKTALKHAFRVNICARNKRVAPYA